MHQNYVVSRLYQLGLKYFKVSSNVNSCQRLLDILNYVIFSILPAKHRFFFRVTDSIQNVIIILLCVCIYYICINYGELQAFSFAHHSFYLPVRIFVDCSLFYILIAVQFQCI